MKYDEVYEKTATMLLGIASDVGVPVGPRLRILDYGCGTGALVKQLRTMGLDAYGADIPQKPGRYAATAEGGSGGDGERSWQFGDGAPSWLRVMTGQPPGLPFDDDFFDLVVSTSVFEHVRDPHFAFQEIHRVTKPGGHSLHIFPSRWAPFERHIKVPFAGVVQEDWWFRLWALLGVRNGHQKGMSWRDAAEWNIEYAHTLLHYLSRRETRQLAGSIFGNVAFPTKAYVRHGYGAAAQLGRWLHAPLWGEIVFALRDRTLYMKKQAG